MLQLKAPRFPFALEKGGTARVIRARAYMCVRAAVPRARTCARGAVSRACTCARVAVLHAHQQPTSRGGTLEVGAGDRNGG